MRVVSIFHYLKIGISFLLVFIGIKLLFHTPLEHIGFKPVYSLYVIILTLAICIVASILFPENKEKEGSNQKVGEKNFLGINFI
jgi:tellurite resistance protein TerC